MRSCCFEGRVLSICKDGRTYGTLLKTSAVKRKKERKPLSKIDRHSCRRRRRRFLILESCNAYEYLRAIAAIVLVVRVERATTAARFRGRLQLL